MSRLVGPLGLVAFLVLAIASSHAAMAAPVAQVTLYYRVVGGGTNQVPSLHYISGGQIKTTNLKSTSTTYIMDAGTRWNASQRLLGSNATLRWEAAGNYTGLAGGGSFAIVYYRQYFVMFSIYNAGNTRSFVFPAVSYKSFNNVTSMRPGQSVWVDFMSNYTYGNATMKQPFSRWYGTGTTGVVSSAATIRPVYIQQYQIGVDLVTSGPDQIRSAKLTGTYGGARINQTVTAPESVVWLDYNSSFTLQRTVYPFNGAYRWTLHSVNGTAANAAVNVTATYIEQYPLSVSFAVSSGVAPSGPIINTSSIGQQISSQLYPGAPPIWADASSQYSISSLLVGSTSLERWVLSGSGTGGVSGPATLNLEYYHQVQVGFSYSISGGGAIGPSNAFYQYLGAQAMVPLGVSRTSVWVDAGTVMEVQGTFSGASPLERWELGSSPSIPVQKPEILSLVYYHQTNLQVTYSISGGGVPTPAVLTGSALGNPIASPILSGNTVWLDIGTPWSLSEFLQSAASGERWAAAFGENGTVGQQASVSVTYIHEFQVTVQANSPSAGTVAQGEWVPVGRSVSLSALPASGWAFARWDGTGQGSYSGRNATVSVTALGPIQETARFDLAFAVRISGGGSVTASFGSASYSVGGNPLTFYVEPGTNVTLVARPGPFETFTGWHGIPAGTAGAVVVVASTPVVVTASFGVNQVLAYGIVVLYWGVAVFAIIYLLRSKRISLRRVQGPRHLVVRNV